jgi:hypothetical protein
VHRKLAAIFPSAPSACGFIRSRVKGPMNEHTRFIDDFRETSIFLLIFLKNSTFPPRGQKKNAERLAGDDRPVRNECVEWQLDSDGSPSHFFQSSTFVFFKKNTKNKM